MRKLICLVLLAVAAPTSAGTSHWTHASEAEFKKGTFHNVVATNLGELKMSRAMKLLLEQDAQVSSVYALAEAPDGTIYAATGPNGILLSIKGDKATPVVKLEDANIFSLKFDAKGALLIGTGGEKGRILRLEKGSDKPVEVFAEETVQYVWAIQQTPDGNIYAATGPNGQLWEIKPDGSKSVMFDCDENNMLSMVSDGKDLLYVGTDPNGLIYRVNRKTKDVFVLFNAAESEISALALDAKGNLYAGTAQASDGPEAEAAQIAATEKIGRPESNDATTPIPSPPHKEPQPPSLPEPTPGEPAPIPKAPAKDPKVQPLFFMEPSNLTALFRDAEGQKGPMPPGTKPKKHRKPTTSPVRPPRTKIAPDAANSGAPAPEGNAIYKIDPSGFVTEIFRQDALVLSIVEHEGVLLVGTGSDGLIYEVNPAEEETSVLAKSDSKQVMCLLPTRDGRIVMGLANTGAVSSMSSGFAPEGSYSSPVLDATQISRFGKVHLHGTLPKGTTLTLATRSGNVRDPASTGWSNWSDEASAIEYVQVPSPTARYLQYRLIFTSTDVKSTPSVDEIDVAYQVPNLPPSVKAIKVIVAATNDERAKAPSRIRNISWEPSDPNSDLLEFSLYFRSQGTGSWVLLKDTLKDPTFDWDTRGVPDGRYEVKVVASDVKANPIGEGKTASRVSESVVVDNTPPVIGDVKTKITGNSVRVDATLADRTSTVAGCEYAVDSHDDWQDVAPSDSIYDSPAETVSFVVDKLSPGAHVVMLRATDDHGNQSFESVPVNIPGDASKQAK